MKPLRVRAVPSAVSGASSAKSTSLAPGRAGTSIHVRARVVAGRGLAAYVRKGSQPDGSLVAALLAEQRNADHAGAVLRFVRGR